MILWILLIFYVFVLLVYCLPTPDSKPTFEKMDFKMNRSSPYQACVHTSDCNNNEKCFQNKCYPTYRGTLYCNTLTGSWALEEIQGAHYLKCTCRAPHIVGQRFEGGNCDVDVACAPHGQLESVFLRDPTQARCLCKKGYRPLSPPRVGCRKLLPSEREKRACDADELDRAEAVRVFHAHYLNQLPATQKCLRNPCTFNILNGAPLRHTRFDPRYGCVCNPRYGNFGVQFEKGGGSGEYLVTTGGYDACGNIFQSEPNIETRVRLFTYFYIKGEPPKSFIQFTGLNPAYVVPELRAFLKDSSLQIDESWPHNYTQYLFENEDFLVHTRECFLESIFQFERCHERLMRRNQMIECDKIIDQVPDVLNRHLQAYSLLYKYPVCKYTASDFAELYKNRYILNPYLLSYKEYRVLMRSNGIEISSWQDDKYIVDLAVSEFDKYEDSSVYPQLRSMVKQASQRSRTLI